ncbi:hypothetical protein CLOP_g24426 [Closterium sp. NIES-67]|nr:hypothetical protein CLOP_g24426 [Closterium sp. NIES-67]
MASLLAAPTAVSLAWSSQLVTRTSAISARATRAAVARASPRRLVCVASERSVHREEKEHVLVRVNLGDHRENLEVESRGGEVYWVPLGKPLGIVFKESATGDIIVDDVKHGGHAEHAPIHKVRLGDRLLATTARNNAPTSTDKFATEPVVLNVAGERFETVMAAITSNASYGGDVILVLERPDECDL